RHVMKTMRLLLPILAVVVARIVAAAEADADAIGKIMGLKPEVMHAIAKIRAPRGDLGAVLDVVKMQPGPGLRWWAAFQAAADAAPRGNGFGGPSIPAKSTVDPKPLEAILGASAQTKDGIAKFSFGRKTSMHGTEVGEAMGVNTWAAFAGSQHAAVVDGDCA